MGVVTSFRLGVIALGILAAWGAVGCRQQSDGLARVAVQGKVAWQGTPLASGSISFLPEQGLKAPSAIADVVQGEYRFTTSNGPVAGAYQVVVMLAPDAKKTMLDAGPGKAAASGKAAPPAKPAPGRWQFRVEVPSRSSFQYDLQLP